MSDKRKQFVDLLNKALVIQLNNYGDENKKLSFFFPSNLGIEELSEILQVWRPDICFSPESDFKSGDYRIRRFTIRGPKDIKRLETDFPEIKIDYQKILLTPDPDIFQKLEDLMTALKYSGPEVFEKLGTFMTDLSEKITSLKNAT